MSQIQHNSDVISPLRVFYIKGRNNLKSQSQKMRKIFSLPFLFILISCNDVKIIESKDNFSCRQELTCFGINNHYSKADGIDGGNRFGDIETSKYHDKILKKYPIAKKENVKNLEKTKTLILKNNSETKAYKVTIQKKINNSKVEYEDFELEPTKSICLGCSEKYFVKLINGGTIEKQEKILMGNPVITKTKYNFLKYEGEVIKSESIDYKIHKTEVVKEY